jgi:hypothetical protein
MGSLGARKILTNKKLPEGWDCRPIVVDPHQYINKNKFFLRALKQ